MISVTAAPDDTGSPSPQDVDGQLQAAVAAFRAQGYAAERDASTLQAVGAEGGFYRVDDPQPAPGEFRWMTQGLLAYGTGVLGFTVLSHDGEDDLVAAALCIVTTACLASGASPGILPASGSIPDLLAAFAAIDRADEACLMVTDFPELLAAGSAPWVGARAADGVDADVRQLAARSCLGRVARQGASLAFGPAAFDAAGAELLRLLRILAEFGASSDSDMRLGVLPRLDALADEGGADAALCNRLRVALLQELLESPRPEAKARACLLLQDCAERLVDPADRFCRARALALLSHCTPTVAGDPAAQRIERSIDWGRRALAKWRFSGQVFDACIGQIRLGLLHATRVFGNRRANLHEAIERYRIGLALAEPGSDNARAAHTDIGLALLALDEGGEEARLREAVSHLETALALAAGDPIRRARAQLNLGNAQLGLGRFDVEALEKAIALYEVALESFPRARDSENWAGIHHNLGAAFAQREIGDRAGNDEQAAIHLRLALEVRTRSAFPRQHLASSAALGTLRARDGAFAEALVHLESAIAADRSLTQSLTLRTELRSWYARSQNIYADAAYCLLKLGRPLAALATAEAGRARELERLADAGMKADADDSRIRGSVLDALLRARANLPADDPASEPLQQMFETELAQWFADAEPRPAGDPPAGNAVDPMAWIQGLAPGELGVVTLLSSCGGATLLLEGGQRAIDAGDIVWHPGFSLTDARDVLMGAKRIGLARGWLRAYFEDGRDRAGWQTTLVESCRVLWQCLVGAIVDAVSVRDPRPERLVVVQSPLLSLLPWHAAWRVVQQERRYVIDDYEVTFVPGLLLMDAVRRREAAFPGPPGSNLASLVVADADPANPLPCAAIEGLLVAQRVGTADEDLLIGEASSFAAVSSGYAGKALLHFACHGRFFPMDPMRSSLSLGRSGLDVERSTGELRLSDLTVWRDVRASVVVLSACETAIAEVADLPSEFLSLANVWLGIGATSVVSALWRVDDFCTLLLMSRFYAAWCGTVRGVPADGNAAAALRQAQLWLKSARPGQIVEEIAALQALAGLTPANAELLESKRAFFGSLGDDERPFAEPWAWSGFACSGLAVRGATG